MDSETTTLLRESLRQALSSSRSGSVGALLDELGWDEVVEEDEVAAVRLLFEEHGRALACSTVLDDIMLRAGDDSVRDCTRILHPLPGGYPIAGGDGSFAGLALGEWAPGDRVALLGRVEGEDAVITVDAVALPRPRPILGLEAGLHWSMHEFAENKATVVAVGERARLTWEPVLAAGHRALASELIGGSRAALDVAVEHVKIRTQFDKPIGAFQAVRHRLAEAYAHLAGADATVEVAWIGRDSWSAASAKAVAAQAHANVIRHAMQVCGAIGLTWEHPLHRYVRRGFVLDALLGSHTTLLESAGRRLLAGEDGPRVCRF